jgi:hypothetical protein
VDVENGHLPHRGQPCVHQVGDRVAVRPVPPVEQFLLGDRVVVA